MHRNCVEYSGPRHRPGRPRSGRPSGPRTPVLGLPPVTAARWRQRAATDWTAYLEARSTSRAPGDGTTGP